jgi:hypothetical protein
MQREDYDAYLSCFNARDYEGVLSYFTDDCEVVFAGYCFKGHRAVRDFYAFFHRHVDERITVNRFLADDETIALEVVVRLEGKGGLTPEMLEKMGLSRLFVLEKGQVLEVPQFIHYHLQAGKFAKALCAVFDPPAETITRMGA